MKIIHSLLNKISGTATYILFIAYTIITVRFMIRLIIFNHKINHSGYANPQGTLALSSININSFTLINYFLVAFLLMAIGIFFIGKCILHLLHNNKILYVTILNLAIILITTILIVVIFILIKNPILKSMYGMGTVAITLFLKHIATN